MGGFAIGLIVLFFFLGGKKASCNYGPNARTLKNIRTKKRVFSAEVLRVFKENNIDTSLIKEVLTHGDVLFSESNTSLDSCKVYVIDTKEQINPIKRITLQNCEGEAIIEKASLK